MSRILVDQVRSNSASADAITLDGSGNVTFPANATCSGTATGFGGGKLLQAVTATSGSATFNYTTTFADSGLSASITPSATSSKILVMVSQHYVLRRGTGAFGGSLCIFRGSTQITDDINGADGYKIHMNNNGSGITYYEQQNEWNTIYLDSPNTTSATTYKTQMRTAWTGSGGPFIGVSNDGTDSYITLLEIGA